MIYKITFGNEYPTDSSLMLNDKETHVESVLWTILGTFWDIPNQQMKEDGYRPDVQKMLKKLYKNFEIFDI